MFIVQTQDNAMSLFFCLLVELCFLDSRFGVDEVTENNSVINGVVGRYTLPWLH